GVSRDAAISYLRSQNLLPIQIEEERDTPRVTMARDGEPEVRTRKKIGNKEIIDFTKQLTTLLRAGVPILPSLDTISGQTDNQNFYEAMQQVQKDLASGSDFSTALGKHPHIFSDLYVNSVRAGEAGGVLDTIMARLSDVLARDADIQKKVKSALRYPLIVTIGMTVAFIVLLIFVVPKFSKMFVDMKLELPLPTKVIIALSQFFLGYWWLLLALGVVVYFGYKQLIKSQTIQKQIDGYLLQIPVVGNLLLKSSMSRFSRMFATLNKAGLPIIQSLQVVARTIPNAVIRDELMEVSKGIERGRGIAMSMKDSPVFPMMVVKMIQVGEESGAIDEMLLHISDYFDEEVSASVEAITDMIEPMLTVMMGGMVLVLALAIFLPMWNLTDLAGQ
ncbi:MAG: type II secretion system F family protein, partial [bacterium]|nr:type II secretion system F family protein [bacterium]